MNPQLRTSVTNIDFKNFNDDITTQIQVNNINSNSEGNFNLKVNGGTNLEEVLSVNSEFDFKNKDLKNIGEIELQRFKWETLL